MPQLYAKGKNRSLGLGRVGLSREELPYETDLCDYQK